MTLIDDRAQITMIVREHPEQLAGFRVYATDGDAGEASEADVQRRVADQDLAVHVPGFLGLFGHDVRIDADAIISIDPDNRIVHVDRIGEWVAASPDVNA